MSQLPHVDHTGDPEDCGLGQGSHSHQDATWDSDLVSTSGGSCEVTESAFFFHGIIAYDFCKFMGSRKTLINTAHSI